MSRAIELADRPKNCILPNPRVGAVIVHRNKIVGEGYHRGPGTAHAEVAAIRSAKRKGFKNFKKSRLFVSLEPCSHIKKRTPPCAPMLVEYAFKEVHIAQLDPNPAVQGNGIRLLRKNKISVKTGLLRKEAEALNQDYIKNQKVKRPYVELKVAMTFDGCISSGNKTQEPLTGPEAQAHTHQLRSRADAIAIGRKTLEVDNPSLNARLSRRKYQKRVVIFGSPKRKLNWKFQKENPNREHLFLESPEELDTHLQYLYEQQGICHLFVEGGAGLASGFLAEDLVDRFHFYYSKGVYGASSGLRLGSEWGLKSLDNSVIVRPESCRILGADVWISGRRHVYRTD